MQRRSEKPKSPLAFFSRHAPSLAQSALAREFGYSGLHQIDLPFGPDPISDLRRAGVLSPSEIAVVAPGRVVVALLRHGFTVIEFENRLDARAAHRYECAGAYRLTLAKTDYIQLE